jgi:large conductance mechanosensitive channel
MKNSKEHGFVTFIRKQGVVGLAVGFILGGAVSGFVDSFVNNLVNPVIGWLFDIGSLASNTTTIGDATLGWGAAVAALINFVIIAAVVYYGVKGLGLDKLDVEK